MCTHYTISIQNSKKDAIKVCMETTYILISVLILRVELFVIRMLHNYNTFHRS